MGRYRKKYPDGQGIVGENPPIYRYMDVDLIDFLGKIAEKVIIHYPNDWSTDIDALYRAAVSDDPDERRLVWHVCSYGTHLNTEHETFIQDTAAFNSVTQYRQNDPDMHGYVIEVIGFEDGVIKGNVYETGDYSEYAWHVKDKALQLDSVSLTYSDEWGVNAGKTITVSHYEYDRDRRRLMSESGDVTQIQYHPLCYLKSISDVLHDERMERMTLPLGNTEAYLEMLSARLDATRPPTQLSQPARASAAKGNPSMTDKLAVADKEAKTYNAQHVQKNTSINKNKEIV